MRVPQYHAARADPEFPSLQGRGLGEGEMACFSGAWPVHGRHDAKSLPGICPVPREATATAQAERDSSQAPVRQHSRYLLHHATFQRNLTILGTFNRMKISSLL
jgi:hypothetical protein